MGSKDFSLTWDDHHSTLVGVFKKLLDSSTLVDCTIAAEGQYLKAHKVVLSACSPYFELLFTQENEKNPIVVLKDIKFQELKLMIDFIYHGKVKIPEDRLADFVTAAESLQIKGLGCGHNERQSKREVQPQSVHKRRGCASPVSQKRIRTSYSENNISSLSPSIDFNKESNNKSENLPQNKELNDLPVSLPPESSVSMPLTSSSVLEHGVAPQGLDSIKTEPSVFYVQSVQTSLPLAEIEPSLPSTETVVKTEPEPADEAFYSEIEHLVEPESEIEEVLFNKEDVTDIAMTGDVCQQSQQNVSQYCDFPTSLETADTRSNESFLMVEMGGHNNAHDAEPVSDEALRVEAPAATGRGPVVDRGRSPWQAPLAAAADVALAPRRSHLRLPKTYFACGRTFLQGKHMRRHLLIHSGEQVGQVCSKAFVRSNNPAVHQRVHTGEECGKTLSPKAQVEQHQRTHTGELPFLCLLCEQSFVNQGSMAAHVRVHTGERPYQCELCGQKFTTKRTMSAHLLVHMLTCRDWRIRCDQEKTGLIL